MKNNQKECIFCLELKPLNDFISEKRSKDGKSSKCKKCNCKQQKEFRKTKLGLINNIYDIQVVKSKKRNHRPPEYNRKEFTEWFLNHSDFDNIYNKWVESNYFTDLRPSVDRLDNKLGYSFNNIRLVTWYENNHKEFENRKNGINNDFSKTIVQYDLNMNFIKEHYSIRSASRELNCLHGGIMRCCKLKQSRAYGFIWRYKEN